jgi:hypothetical protein
MEEIERACRADDDAAAASRFEAEGAGELEDAEAGREAVFRMRLRPHDASHSATVDRLIDGGKQARWRPEGMPTVRTRRVLGDGRMPSPEGDTQRPV